MTDLMGLIRKEDGLMGEGGAVEEGRGGRRGAHTGQEGDLRIKQQAHIQRGDHGALQYSRPGSTHLRPEITSKLEPVSCCR